MAKSKPTPDDTLAAPAPGSPLLDGPAAEPVDRDGYTVTEQGLADNEQTTWSIVRDADGVGLGAYASQADVDRVVVADRAAQEAAAEQRAAEAAAAEAAAAAAADTRE